MLARHWMSLPVGKDVPFKEIMLMSMFSASDCNSSNANRIDTS